MQFQPEFQPHHIDRQPEKQRVEGQDRPRQLPQRRHLDSDDVNCVGEGREHHKRDPGKTERSAVPALVQQRDAGKGQNNAEHRHRRDFFMEEQRHDDRHHDRIDEEDRRCDSRIHMAVGEE